MRWLVVRAIIFACLLPLAINAQFDPGTAFFDPTRPPVEAYSFDLTGGGARAEGMGRAFIGVSDDIDGGSWNPAGLYLLEKPVLSFSYGFLAPRGTTEATIFQMGRILDHSGSFSDLTSAAFAAPVRVKGHQFVGTINFTRNFDQFAASSFDWVSDSIVFLLFQGIFDTMTVEQQVHSDLQGGLNSVNIGFGTRIYDNISFGLSINILSGETIREQAFRADMDSVPDQFTPNLYSRQQLDARIIDSNKFSGVNGTIGLKLNAEKVQLGLVGRIPLSTLQTETDRKNHTIIKEAGVSDGVLREILNVQQFNDNLVAQYHLPPMIGVGGGYRIDENFLIAADVELRMFANQKVDLRDSIRIDPGGSNEEFFTEVDPQWKNAFVVRLGGEYLKETGIGVVPIRAGFGYTPQPVPSLDLSGETTTAVNYTSSVGSGIHWSQIHLDIAYSYSMLDWDVATQNFGSSELRNRNHHINFSFTGVF